MEVWDQIAEHLVVHLRRGKDVIKRTSCTSQVTEKKGLLVGVKVIGFPDVLRADEHGIAGNVLVAHKPELTDA